MKEFVRGMTLLGRGFGYWRKLPRRMALGLIPAAIVGAFLLAGLITLGVNLPWITETITPFADGWPGLWVTVIRIAAGTAVLGAALVLVAVTFTALTLFVGDPFYERIWKAVEADLGETGLGDGPGFWRSVGDGLGLLVRGLGVAIVAALLGFIPVVGTVTGAVVGVLLTGWLLASELAGRGLSARGLTSAEQRTLLRRNRPLALGFGAATQLCFLVPLGAVATMPAAVAGSTLLARELRASV